LRHKLVVGDVGSTKSLGCRGLHSQTILSWLRCGVYAHEHVKGFLIDCEENRNASGLSAQLKRLRGGRYPATHRRYANWSVSNLRTADAAQAEWLIRPSRAVPQPFHWARTLDMRWDQRLLLLTRCGLSSADLDSLRIEVRHCQNSLVPDPWRESTTSLGSKSKTKRIGRWASCFHGSVLLGGPTPFSIE